ncbi:hypothetical protein DEU56DRAFT_759412 [Suillus clintonianus]|uniref:uncharacterized protein n=1 Tax=Suillus clintonianus TaxID=1904413 RepID=UPI001B860C38|nr:uncharacterized protein DEU56DRAFT_759412 [Suillus clintonianus]KAG2125169.1 hypothetical protein DEU56DRAFT_759412 [Suillus clintonianus]
MIDDKTHVKGVFALGQPTQATEMISLLWTTLSKAVNIKEWTAHAGTDQTGAPEFIIVNTEQLYSKALAGIGERSESKPVEGTSPTDGSAKDSGSEAAITTNTFYESSILPDYRGDLFQHVNAKLRQLDISKLIVPADWYSSLRCGTLVMIRATLHTFNWKEHRVYQLNAHTICVMDPSELEIEPLSSQPNRFDYGVNTSSSKSRASDTMAGVQLKKRSRED